ncbi:MAG: hypothetical protein L0338_25370 [Acidobacteria bacterium]|nr:hypothetical protein [Acidobacteriota bacterium]
MTNEETKSLALSFLRADSEDEVIALLKKAGFWDQESVWRLVGDRDGNFATIGNQQSRPEAALVEKIVNSVDARLMNQCLTQGIDPASAAAPPTIRHAVSRFFENREPKGELGGTLQNWPQSKQLEHAQYITLSVTGAMPRAGDPCLTVVDMGEGQTPAMMPETFLSIDRQNKLRIPFVQGKFNMGGTGVLKFCGRNSLQLIITKRNPVIVAAEKNVDPGAGRWGFTIVRRERPTEGAGHVKNSVFSYLAPVAGPQSSRGNVLSFDAPSLPLMPDKNQPYERPISWGSTVKLYQYDMKGFRSHALMKGGLLSRLELLLPGIALPVRVHECRAYRGDEARSFANTLVGTFARLEENRGDNLESGYPTSVPLSVHGEEMIARIYAFKTDKAETYRTNEGIIFVINGQTHGAIPKTFFERSKVKMSRLAKSLLVVVDCSSLSVGAREDLFMNSRDRLSNGELRKSIEEELEDLVSRHPGLRELRERRRSEEIAERLQDSRPLENVLGSILKSSPTLARLFLLGQRLNQPHRASDASGQKDGGGGADPKSGEFHGRKHPTFFRFYHKSDGETLVRNAELGRRCRIKFDTDVENEYFSRTDLPGHYHVEILEGPIEGIELDHSLTLHNGIANWSINLPEDSLTEGDKLTVQCTVTDEVVAAPLVNIAQLRVVARSEPPDHLKQGRPLSRKGAGNEAGSGDGSDDSKRGDESPSGIQMPVIIRVREDDDNWKLHHFDEKTACKVLEDGVGDEDNERSEYTFYVNIDNVFLRTDMKGAVSDVAIMQAKFVYGNVLVGLALIHDERNRHNGSNSHNRSDSSEDEETIEASVERTTRAMGPFLVPMIDYLGALSADDVVGLARTGDDE